MACNDNSTVVIVAFHNVANNCRSTTPQPTEALHCSSKSANSEKGRHFSLWDTANVVRKHDTKYSRYWDQGQASATVRSIWSGQEKSNQDELAPKVSSSLHGVSRTKAVAAPVAHYPLLLCVELRVWVSRLHLFSSSDAQLISTTYSSVPASRNIVSSISISPYQVSQLRMYHTIIPASLDHATCP